MKQFFLLKLLKFNNRLEQDDANHYRAWKCVSAANLAPNPEPGTSYIIIALQRAVNNHWTGLVEWTTGMDYWNHFMLSNEICSDYISIPT